MIIFKITPIKLHERLELRKYGNDRFGANRVVIVSDQKDPKKASSETFAVKDLLKTKYKAAFDGDKKMWWWNDKFRSETELVALAAKACDEANELLQKKGMADTNTSGEEQSAQNPKLAEVLKVLADIKDLVMNTTALSPEEQTGKQVVEQALDKFVEELANEVDDVRLNAKLKEYFDWMSKFYNYSFNNKILIYIQRPTSTQVLSKSKWEKAGFTPKPDAQHIWIWGPMFRKPNDFEKRNVRKNGKGNSTRHAPDYHQNKKK